jgi:hypothetical protein
MSDMKAHFIFIAVCAVFSNGLAGCAGEEKSREENETKKPLTVSMVDLPKEIAPGTKFEFKMVLRNNSDAAITVCIKPGFKIASSCKLDGVTELKQRPGGGPRKVVRPGGVPLSEYYESDFVTLASGEEYTQTRSESFPLEFRHEVEMTCSFESKYKGEKVGKDAWVGKVEGKAKLKLLKVAAVPPPQPPGDF